MVVEAIELLVGGRADAALVRPGADEAVVEGRFVDATATRSCSPRVRRPADGRSRRAYVDGRLATGGGAGRARRAGSSTSTASTPTSRCSRRPTQRDALDRFGGVDLAPLREARRRARRRSTPRWPTSAATSGPGPARSTCSASRSTSSTPPASTTPTRTSALEREEDRARRRRRPPRGGGLAAARGDGRRAARRRDALTGRRGVVGARRAGARSPTPRSACAALAAELADVAAELRATGERIDDDPERLEAVRERRQLLARPPPQVRRRPSTDVDRRWRRGALRARPGRARGPRPAAPPQLDAERAGPPREAARPPRRRSAAAAAAAPRPGRGASQATWPSWPCPGGRSRVEVDGTRSRRRRRRSCSPPTRGRRRCPLAKVASGGELARAMLALRLVLTDAARPRSSSTRSTPASAARRPSPSGRALARLRRRAPGARRHPPAAGGGLRRRPGRRWPRTSDDEATVAAGRGPRPRRTGRRAVPDAVRDPRVGRDRRGARRRAAGDGAPAGSVMRRRRARSEAAAACRRRRAGRRGRPGAGRPPHEGPRQAAPARRHRGHRPRGPRPGRRRDPDRRGAGGGRQRRGVDHRAATRTSVRCCCRAAGIPLARRRRHRGAGPSIARGRRRSRSTATGCRGRRRRGRHRGAPDDRQPSTPSSTWPAANMGPSSSGSPRTPSSTSARRATSSSTTLDIPDRALDDRGPARAHRRAGHRLQGGPRRCCAGAGYLRREAAAARSASTAAPTRCSRSALKPDVIIGDFDSVSERALRCGAALVVHGYPDGRAPGAERLDDLGPRPRRLRSAGHQRGHRHAPRLRAGRRADRRGRAPTARWSSSSTRAGPAWRRRSSCA